MRESLGEASAGLLRTSMVAAVAVAKKEMKGMSFMVDGCDSLEEGSKWNVRRAWL